MKIYILGDIHANVPWLRRNAERAVDKSCNVLFQLGDFGYFPCYRGEELLDDTAAISQQLNLPIYFIEGNHDDVKTLRNTYKDETKEGFIKVRENVFYVPRGTKWYWDNVSLMGVGGAYSIDKQSRLEDEKELFSKIEKYDAMGWTLTGMAKKSAPILRGGGHVLWFPEETITQEELSLIKSRGEVDVLFTHDAPTNVPMKNLKIDIESNIHRQIMNEVGLATKPKFWFHGHYHAQMQYEFGYEFNTKVFGLNCDHAQGSYAILDTKLLNGRVDNFEN